MRQVRLIADGFGLPRTEVERLPAEGNLVSTVRLSGKLSGDFNAAEGVRRGRLFRGVGPAL